MAHKLDYNFTVFILKTKPLKGLITALKLLRDKSDFLLIGKLGIYSHIKVGIREVSLLN